MCIYIYICIFSCVSLSRLKESISKMSLCCKQKALRQLFSAMPSRNATHSARSLHEVLTVPKMGSMLSDREGPHIQPLGNWDPKFLL